MIERCEQCGAQLVRPVERLEHRDDGSHIDETGERVGKIVVGGLEGHVTITFGKPE